MKRILKKLFLMVIVFSILTSNVQPIYAASDTYVNNYKWNKSVVNVYIDSTPYMNGASSQDYLMWKLDIQWMISRWNTFLEVYGLNIRFNEVNNLSSADTIIKYGVSSSWANVSVQTSGTTITKATVILDDWDFFNYNLTDEIIQRIVVHELGHVLGLKDIAPTTAENNSIFSVMVNDVTGSANFEEFPTEFDFNNLKKLY